MNSISFKIEPAIVDGRTFKTEYHIIATFYFLGKMKKVVVKIFKKGVDAEKYIKFQKSIFSFLYPNKKLTINKILSKLIRLKRELK